MADVVRDPLGRAEEKLWAPMPLLLEAAVLTQLLLAGLMQSGGAVLTPLLLVLAGDFLSSPR